MIEIIIASEAKKKAVQVLTRPEHLSMLYSTWPCLARELEVEEVNIKALRDRIIWGTCYIPDAVSAVIEDWVSKMGSEATLSILINTLEKLGLKYIGEALKEEFDIGNMIVGEEATNEILFNNTLPENMPYYIPRTLISRYILDSDQLFKRANSVKDVFCFSGIQRYELANYVKNSVTDNSSAQIQRQQLSTRFIVLDGDPHFTKICRKTNEPVHWLKFSQNDENTSAKVLKWVQSTTNVEVIQRSVNLNSDRQEKLTEAQLLQIAEKNRKPVCFSDCPGMGKSTILINIGHKIKEMCPERIIVHFDLRILVQKLKDCKSSNTKLALESILLQTLCSAVFGKAMEHVNAIFCTDSVKIELLLDGFDEIFPGDVDNCLQIIKDIKALKYTRIWIASRPHFLARIENALNILGYNIHPFTEGNQKEFLSSYWLSQNQLLSKIKLAELADKALEIISSQTKDQDFAGIPLRCYLIAQVFEETAMDFCTAESEDEELPDLLTISSTYDLFTKMIELKFRKYYSTYGITKYRQGALARMLMKLAMNLIFPGQLEKLDAELESLDVSVCDLINTGLLLRQGADDVNGVKFVHQTVAEYFCAKFVSDLVKQKVKGKEWTKELKEFLFQEVLQLDTTTYVWSAPSHESVYRNRNPTITVNCVKLFCKEAITSNVSLLRENGTINLTFRKFENCLIPFSHPVICYFLNSLFRKKDGTPITVINSDCTIDSLKNIIWICVKNNFFNIFKILTCELSGFYKSKLFDRDFLFVLLHYGQLDFVKVGFAFFEKYQSLDLKLKHYILSHVGYLDNYSAFEYFCEEKNLKEVLLGDAATGILISIIMRSCYEYKNEIYQKEQIIRYTLSVNPFLIKIMPVYAFSNCHVKLLHCLIELGLDVEAQDESSGDTFLHCINNEGTTIDQLLQLLCSIPLDKFKRLVQVQNKKEKKILYTFLEKFYVPISILEQFKIANADFNSCNNEGNSLLWIAIEYRQGVEIVKYLLKEGTNPNHVNKRGMSILFVFKPYRNDMSILEELVKAGCDVFRQEEGFTFLHALLIPKHSLPLSPSQFHAIVKILIENGKEKLLVTKSEKEPYLTPLQLAVKNNKMTKETVFMLKSIQTVSFGKLMEEVGLHEQY